MRATKSQSILNRELVENSPWLKKTNTIVKVCILSSIIYGSLGATLYMYQFIDFSNYQTSIFCGSSLFFGGSIIGVYRCCVLNSFKKIPVKNHVSSKTIQSAAKAHVFKNHSSLQKAPIARSDSVSEKRVLTTPSVTPTSTPPSSHPSSPRHENSSKEIDYAQVLNEAIHADSDSRIRGCLPKGRTPDSKEITIWSQTFEEAIRKGKSDLAISIFNHVTIQDPQLLERCLKEALRSEQLDVALLILSTEALPAWEGDFDSPATTDKLNEWYNVYQASIFRSPQLATLIAKKGIKLLGKENLTKALEIENKKTDSPYFVDLFLSAFLESEAFKKLLEESKITNASLWGRILVILCCYNEKESMISLLRSNKVTDSRDITDAWKVLIDERNFSLISSFLTFLPHAFRSMLDLPSHFAMSEADKTETQWKEVLVIASQGGFDRLALSMTQKKLAVLDEPPPFSYDELY